MNTGALAPEIIASAAWESARTFYFIVSGKPFIDLLDFKIEFGSQKLALICDQNGKYEVRLSATCMFLLENLFHGFREDSSQFVETALEWLVLHELSHVDLGHFELADSFGVAQRSSMKHEPLDRLSPELRPLAPLCLEMQADHEAAEMLLGAYSREDWQGLRQHVLAISGMMMLIEREDAKNGFEHCTHPKAATRIFQLLGHVAEMPLIWAHLRGNASAIPSEEELHAFARQVTIPCFFDAVQLAQDAEAASIARDLGSAEDFFRDIEIAKLGEQSRYADFKTEGAREWARLWPCNEALKPILGGHFTT